MAYLPGDNVTIKIPVRELRDLFNALEIARKGRERVLVRERVWSSRQRPRHLPVGSQSVIWHYYVPQNRWLLAIAHVYLARGGQVIGEPDPKQIRIDQLVLKPDPSAFAE